MGKTDRGFEVHEHCYIAGPRANTSAYKFSHSHDGGDVPHEHPDTGPAARTIDKDEWMRATGLVGGGRKRFTRKPTGVALPTIAIDESRLTYRLIIHESCARSKSAGPGIGPVVRLGLVFGMRPVVE